MGTNHSSNITDDDGNLTSNRVAGISAVALFTIVAVGANLYLFIGRLIMSRRGDTLNGFDSLVLSLLFADFCLALLVYPYDIVAYVILNGHWPFSTNFCYASTLFTSVFPFVACWSVVGMTLHQFFSYIYFVFDKSLSTNMRKCPRFVSVSGPAVIMWLVTLCIYCPVSHTHWDVITNLYQCSLDGTLLHESIWYFWIPFAITCLTTTSMLTVYLLTRVPLPMVQNDSIAPINEPAVRWSDLNTIQENNQPNRDVYSSLNPLYMDYPTDSDVNVMDSIAPPEHHATNASISVQTEHENAQIAEKNGLYLDRTQGTELRMENLATCLLFTGTLLVFVAPYAITLLLYHVSIETENFFEIHEHLWSTVFAWMTTKPLWEPFLLLAVAPTYRRAAFRCLSRPVSLMWFHF